jgi:hypothetical protein
LVERSEIETIVEIVTGNVEGSFGVWVRVRPTRPPAQPVPVTRVPVTRAVTRHISCAHLAPETMPLFLNLDYLMR